MIRSLACWILMSALSQTCCRAHEYFAIRVVDQETGRGVPLVELRTVNNICLYTDSAGVAAFYEPGLMDQTVFFHVSSHGYEFPKDGFGYRGTRLAVQPGGSATLKIKRRNLAQRLYRITGAGIYRDSILIDENAPVLHPNLNAQVLGSDSVVNEIFDGKIYWFWGDTQRPSYPLGNFDVPGAVSKLPGDGGLDPDRGVKLDYFVDDSGFAKPTAKLPGQGPTWITSLFTLTDNEAVDRLYASYVKIQPPLTVYERGLAEFNKDTQQFTKRSDFPMDAPLFPQGHPLKQTIDGIEYLYFADPFPLVRVRATMDAVGDWTQYETYTCLAKGSRSDSLQTVQQSGVAQFGWTTDTVPYDSALQARLIKLGRLPASQPLIQLSDENGKEVLMHRGSVNWNAFRKRWIMIAVQSFGTSALGEVWYAEADDLIGPWINARKIASHDKYSFYNPKHHAMFDQQGGRLIYFEGTYTHTFSGNDVPTPRYDYNQIMYRLDLADPGLKLPEIQ